MKDHDMTRIENQLACVDSWVTRKRNGDTISKAAFCREWGTSPRSLGRWLKKYEVKTEQNPAPQVTEVAKNVKVNDTVRVVCNDWDLIEFATNEEVKHGGIYRVTDINDGMVLLDDLHCGWVMKNWVEPVQEAPEEKSSNEDDYQYIVSNQSVMITKNGETVIVHRESPNYRVVVDLLMEEEYERAWNMSSIKKAIETFSHGKIKVEDDKVFYGTFEVRNGMADKLIDMVKNGEEGTKAFCSFFEAVMTDVESDHIREQLWPFIESQCIELNEDGTFTGYRSVRPDYLDKHTGTIDNSVGQEVSMPRHLVNSDPNQRCSAGLHVGSLEYAKGFGCGRDRLIKVKCHVRDVVSVPYEYDAGKLRCCRFKVIEDVTDKI